MKRKEFIKDTAITLTGLPLLTSNCDTKATSTIEKSIPSESADYIYLLRHATLMIQLGGLKLLIDPLLGDKEAYGAIGTNGENKNRRNPMVGLPISKQDVNNLLNSIDAVLVTHTHTDHWDKKAIELIDKSKKIFCQPEDIEDMKKAGFIKAEAISSETTWNNIKITRTGGQHGKGEIAKEMAPVSGYVLENGKTKIYIAGDTIWCKEVEEAISKHQPSHIVVNAGGAQFEEGDPITMDAADVITTCKTAANSKVIAVHMDTINHCHITRVILKEKLAKNNLLDKALLPTDGETIFI
jgi:L-ascorbate metabolism protein UlaG (beta-lactamase superfamily)